MTSKQAKALDYYKDTTPTLDIKDYFNGDIKAWGLVQDWRRRVIARFDIDMHGSWQGDHGILQEHFQYYNGKQQQRIWKINKHHDGTYLGTTDGLIGNATGAVQGSAVKWAYTMDIDVDNKTYRIDLDDWMWQMNDGVLINRSYLKKFGITVAELTLFMQK